MNSGSPWPRQGPRRTNIRSTGEADPAFAAAGGDEDGAGCAGRGGGGGDAADVGDAATVQYRADGVALGRLLAGGEDVGQKAGGRLEHLGPQGVQRPQQLAVLDQFGLAAQAAVDVSAG